MAQTTDYRSLTVEEIAALQQQGCAVDNNDWTTIQVSDRFPAALVHDTYFSGQVRIGALGGMTGGDPARPSEIRRAALWIVISETMPGSVMLVFTLLIMKLVTVRRSRTWEHSRHVQGPDLAMAWRSKS